MKITEIVAPTAPQFFHGSRWGLPVNFVLEPQSDGYVRKGTGDPETDKWGRVTEQILEKFRPRTMLSRYKSVFMVDRPDVDLIERAGGGASFIYQVEPLGRSGNLTSIGMP